MSEVRDPSYTETRGLRLPPTTVPFHSLGREVKCTHADQSVGGIFERAEGDVAFFAMAVKHGGQTIGVYASFDAERCREQAAAWLRMADCLDGGKGKS